MKSRFSARTAAAPVALAAALALSGCGGGDNSLNQAAAASENAPLPQIAAPNNGDWTQVISETPENGYLMGNPDAPVKLVEYASITCHVCAEFSEAAHDELVNQFVRSGQVSWEYRPFMLFPTDPGLFLLLRCQGPQPFFGLAEQLYANQSEWAARTQRLPEAEVARLNAMPPQQQSAALVRAIEMDQFFRQRGLAESRVDACLSNQEELQKLVQSNERGAREGVTGTPSFFINGEAANVTAWSALKPRLRQAIGS